MRVIHGTGRPNEVRTMRLKCPNGACGELVTVKMDAERAACPRCGNVWSWVRRAVVHGVRRA